MEDKNYYDILGVSVKATAEEITAAKILWLSGFIRTPILKTALIPRSRCRKSWKHMLFCPTV